MSRKLALALATFMGASFLAAPGAAEASGMYATASGWYCPDPYCGTRAYPDPYIWDGWKISRGYKGPEAYGRSWYLLRTLRPIYIEPGSHRYGQVRTKVHLDARHKESRVYRKRR